MIPEARHLARLRKPELGLGMGLGLGLGVYQSWNPINGLGSALLERWWAAATSTLTLSGSNVTTWASQISGLAPTQATSGFKPTWSATGLNGKPAVTFDGTDDYLTIASLGNLPSGATGSEIWALVSQDALVADASVRVPFGYGNATAAARYAVRRVVTSTNRAGSVTGDGATGQTLNNTTVDFSGIHLVRARFEATQTLLSLDDGTASTLSVVPNTATSRTTIGANATASLSGPWKGSIADLLVTSLLTTAQATQLAAYLKAEGGIA